MCASSFSPSKYLYLMFFQQESDCSCQGNFNCCHIYLQGVQSWVVSRDPVSILADHLVFQQLEYCVCCPALHAWWVSCLEDPVAQMLVGRTSVQRNNYCACPFMVSTSLLSFWNLNRGDKAGKISKKQKKANDQSQTEAKKSSFPFSQYSRFKAKSGTLFHCKPWTS